MPRGGIETTIGHWSQLLGGLTASPQEFYASIEAAVKRREIPDCQLSRVDWHEGGTLSAKREYLRAERAEFVIDICGAPFGNAFFASSWLCGPPPSLKEPIAIAIGSFVLLAFLGQARWAAGLWWLVLLFFFGVVAFGIIRPLFFPPRLTYYRVDTAEMFYQSIQAAVLEVIDGLSSAQGLRLLTEAERKPVMRGFGR
jgi:hypothetical protein